MSHLSKLVVAMLLVGAAINAAAQHNATVIGGESYVRDCYARSQHASISRSATRLDIEVCDRAIAEGGLIKSELAATYSNRGVIYMAMDDLKSAYKDYQRALEIDENLAEAFINRGNLWAAVQRYKEAIADYDSALANDTNMAQVAWLNRGLANEKLGNLELAKKDYQASLKVNADWQTALDKLARVNRKLKEKAEAR